MSRLLLLLPLALLLSACVKTTYLHEQDAVTADSPYGTWELVELDADRGLSALPSTNPVTLTLGPGVAQNVEGQSFINRYSGSLRLDETGRVVEVPRIAMTRMAGPSPLMELESEYFRRWQDAERIVRSGDELLVYDSDGRVVIRFRRPTRNRR